MVCASRHGAHGSSEQHARISTPLCPIHVYSICIYTYVHTGSTCMPRCVDGRSHTRTHTRMREVQARLILPDRATCIYCALFRACAFFRDVREREREKYRSTTQGNRCCLSLFFSRGEGGFCSVDFFFGDRVRRAKAKLRNDDVKDGRVKVSETSGSVLTERDSLS